MARRSTPPRELVRLTPLQFSLSISIVVLLAAGTGLAGYFHGYRKAVKEAEAARDASVGDRTASPDRAGEASADSQAPVTFYTALTAPRPDAPTAGEQKTDRREPRAPVPDPEPAPVAAPVPSSPEKGGSVMLQVASYDREEAARMLLEKLQADGYRGAVERADLGDRGTWYRVKVGPYAGEKDAKLVLDKLREERGLKGFIVKTGL